MKEQPPRAARPLPAQVPTAFVRVRAHTTRCRPQAAGRRTGCARSHRVARL
jgi:hypothetical protein